MLCPSRGSSLLYYPFAFSFSLPVRRHGTKPGDVRPRVDSVECPGPPPGTPALLVPLRSLEQRLRRRSGVTQAPSSSLGAALRRLVGLDASVGVSSRRAVVTLAFPRFEALVGACDASYYFYRELRVLSAFLPLL